MNDSALMHRVDDFAYCSDRVAREALIDRLGMFTENFCQRVLRDKLAHAIDIVLILKAVNHLCQLIDR